MHKTAAPITMPSMVMLLLRNAEHRSNEVEEGAGPGVLKPEAPCERAQAAALAWPNWEPASIGQVKRLIGA